jgi:hypothetical protein
VAEIEPIDVLLGGMAKASENLPADWDSMFGGSAYQLARFLADRFQTLTTEQITTIVGIGGLLLRQKAKLEADRAMFERLRQPEGRA